MDTSLPKPPVETFHFVEQEYSINEQILCGRVCAQLRPLIEEERTRKALALLSQAQTLNFKALESLALKIIDSPIDNPDYLDSCRNPDHVAIILQHALNLNASLAKQIAYEYPCFPLLSDMIVKASGWFGWAAKNSPPPQRSGEQKPSTSEPAPLETERSTDTSAEAMAG